MSSIPDSPDEVNDEPPPVYVLGRPGGTWHPLRDPAADLTHCGLANDWHIRSNIPPHPEDVCPACSQVLYLGLLVQAGGEPRHPWAATGRDVLPWLTRRQGERNRRFVLTPDGPPRWRRLLRRLGR